MVNSSWANETVPIHGEHYEMYISGDVIANFGSGDNGRKS